MSAQLTAVKFKQNLNTLDGMLPDEELEMQAPGGDAPVMNASGGDNIVTFAKPIAKVPAFN